MKLLSIPALFSLLLSLYVPHTFAEEEGASVQKYIDLGEFKVNLKKGHLGAFKAQLYATSDLMEKMVKLHQPRIKGTILNRFSMISIKQFSSKKKRRKTVKKILKEIRKRILSFELPTADGEEQPLNPEDLRELLITSIIYQ